MQSCISSVLEVYDDKENYEIIIVDNTSEEEVEKIKNTIQIYKDLNISVRFSGGNLGYGVGNNIGASIAKGEILCFLNPDTILIEDIFSSSIAQFKNIEIRTVGVQLVNEKRERELSFFFIRSYFTIFLTPLVKFLNSIQLIIPNMVTSGACLFTRREDFLKVGGFDNKSFLYNEESFLARKYKQHFKKVNFKFLKGKKLIHLEKTGEANFFLRQKYYESTARYYSFFEFKKSLIIVLFSIKSLLRSIKKMNLKKESFEEFNFIKKYWNEKGK